MPLGIRSKIKVFSRFKTCCSYYVDFSILGQGRINYVTVLPRSLLVRFKYEDEKKIKKGLSNKTARIANSKE